MADTFIEYTADGGTTDFSIPFSYISESHVKVYLDDVETSAWSFLNASTVRMDSAPSNGTVVKVQRVTPRDQKLVDFVDGSVLTETDLDLANTQLIYVVQEAYDNLGAEARDAIAADKTETEEFRDDAYEFANRAADSQYTSNDGTLTGYSAYHYMEEARQWAVEAEDVSVTDTDGNSGYSAYHWAQKAEASNTATQAAADSFDDVYLGEKASEPTLDNDGDALQTGALYFDTSVGKLRVYTGSDWIDAGTASESRFLYIATDGQTSFSGADDNGITLAYTVGAIDVFLNGVKLISGTDFTATDGSTLTLTEAAAAGDELQVTAFGAFNVANTYTKAEVDGMKADRTGDTFTGEVIFDGGTFNASEVLATFQFQTTSQGNNRILQIKQPDTDGNEGSFEIDTSNGIVFQTDSSDAVRINFQGDLTAHNNAEVDGDLTVQGAIMNPGVRACVARRSSDSGLIVSASSWNALSISDSDVVYNTETLGTDFSPNAGLTSGDHFVVPSGVSLIRVTAGVELSGWVSNLRITIKDSLGNTKLVSQFEGSDSGTNLITTTTGLFPVVAGDAVFIDAYNATGSSRAFKAWSTFISIEIVG